MMNQERAMMTKLQRYDVYVSGVCESGCGEAMDDNGDYYKVDEVDVAISREVIAKEHYKEQAELARQENEKLQAEKKELFDTMQMYCDKARKLEVKQTKLQARIDELETLLCTATDYSPEKHPITAYNHYQRMYEIKKRKIIADFIDSVRPDISTYSLRTIEAKLREGNDDV